MTKQIIDYPTRDLMKIGKTSFNALGSRVLHTDFVNNDESQGYRVTFVDGIDDPNNDPARVAERAQVETNRLRKDELNNKPVLSIPEMRELLRLSI